MLLSIKAKEVQINALKRRVIDLERQLVQARYFDDSRFYRVVPGFVAQFGLAKDPELTASWRSRPIPDDAVHGSNTQGKMVFAMSGLPHSRSTQLFINLADNPQLDSMGFAPVAELSAEGLAVLERLYVCGEEPNQDDIKKCGGAYLDQEFPELSRIVRATLVALHVFT